MSTGGVGGHSVGDTLKWHICLLREHRHTS